MRHVQIFFLFFAFLFCSDAIFAATKKDVPPWMEDIDTSGRSTYLIPKGAMRKIVGSQVLVEAPSEYVARRLYEMEGYLETRFKKIEQEQEDLKEELLKIKEAIEKIDESSKTAMELNKLSGTVKGLEKRIEALTAEQELSEPSDKADELIGVIEETDEPKNAVDDWGREESLEGEEIGIGRKKDR